MVLGARRIVYEAGANPRTEARLMADGINNRHIESKQLQQGRAARANLISNKRLLYIAKLRL